MKRKLTLGLITLLVIAIIPLTIKLTQQTQEIRKKASSPENVLLFLEAERPGPYYTDESLVVNLKINTQNNPIDTVQIFLAKSPAGIPLAVQTQSVAGLSWQLIDTENQTMKFLASARLGSAFQNNQPQTLISFTFTPTNPEVQSLIFDRNFTRALIAGSNIIGPLADSVFSFGIRPTPTPTPIPTPTPTPAPTQIHFRVNFQGIDQNSAFQPNRQLQFKAYANSSLVFEDENINLSWKDDHYYGGITDNAGLITTGSYRFFIQDDHQSRESLYLRLEAPETNIIVNQPNTINLVTTPLLVGNLNGDELIEATDLSLLLSKITEYGFEQLSQQVAEDFNADYYVDATDLSLLLNNVFKYNDELP